MFNRVSEIARTNVTVNKPNNGPKKIQTINLNYGKQTPSAKFSALKWAIVCNFILTNGDTIWFKKLTL